MCAIGGLYGPVGDHDAVFVDRADVVLIVEDGFGHHGAAAVHIVLLAADLLPAAVPALVRRLVDDGFDFGLNKDLILFDRNEGVLKLLFGESGDGDQRQTEDHAENERDDLFYLNSSRNILHVVSKNSYSTNSGCVNDIIGRFSEPPGNKKTERLTDPFPCMG